VLQRLQRTQATIQGKSTCPECQSMVVVREGVQPRCTFCGAEFDAPT
jgi:ribosomal protein L37AE/L43A